MEPIQETEPIIEKSVKQEWEEMEPIYMIVNAIGLIGIAFLIVTFVGGLKP